MNGGMPSALLARLDAYVAGLFSLARDPAGAVRKAVCAGLVQMLQLKPELLAPQMLDIIEYMLECSQVRRSHLFRSGRHAPSGFLRFLAQP